METTLGSQFIARFRREIHDEWPEFVLIVLASGVSDAILRILINATTLDAMEGQVSPRHLAMFLSMLTIHLVSRYLLLRQAGLTITHIVYGYRTRISGLLANAELSQLEQINRSEIELVLGRDIATISAPSGPLINPLTTAVCLVLTLVYLGFLSPWTFILVTALHILFVIYFYGRRKRVIAGLKETSRSEAGLFRKVSGLLQGFKEVKLNRQRRDELLEEHVGPLSDAVRMRQGEVNRLQAQNWVSVDSFHYAMMAIPLFILPGLALLAGSVVAQIITLVVFIIGSVPEIIISFSLLSQYDVATQNLETLSARLTRPTPNGDANGNLLLKQVKSFESLELKGLTYSYLDAKKRKLFAVGPVDLTLRRGELLFVVGGNGSGKTTLLRNICGLYLPQAGTIALNGVPVDEDNLDTFRGFFSAVFSDFHIFDRLYGLKHVSDEQVQALLDRFMLQDKTVFHDRQFSTIDLSTGQRKRLALLTALLEDRPICILDEVSADQDPEFRRFYYEELLPELKRQGRTLLVVSHDNRYFHVADRILRLEDGQVVALESPGAFES